MMVKSKRVQTRDRIRCERTSYTHPSQGDYSSALAFVLERLEYSVTFDEPVQVDVAVEFDRVLSRKKFDVLEAL